MLPISIPMPCVRYANAEHALVKMRPRREGWWHARRADWVRDTTEVTWPTRRGAAKVIYFMQSARRSATKVTHLACRVGEMQPKSRIRAPICDFGCIWKLNGAGSSVNAAEVLSRQGPDRARRSSALPLPANKQRSSSCGGRNSSSGSEYRSQERRHGRRGAFRGIGAAQLAHFLGGSRQIERGRRGILAAEQSLCQPVPSSSVTLFWMTQNGSVFPVALFSFSVYLSVAA